MRGDARQINEWVIIPREGGDDTRFHLTCEIPVLTAADTTLEGESRVWSGREYQWASADFTDEAVLALAGAGNLGQLTAGLRRGDAAAIASGELLHGLSRLAIIDGAVWVCAGRRRP